MTSAQRKELAKLITALIEELTQKEARRIEPNRVANDDGGPDDDAQPLNEMEQAIASNRTRNDAVQLQRLQAASSFSIQLVRFQSN